MPHVAASVAQGKPAPPVLCLVSTVLHSFVDLHTVLFETASLPRVVALQQ